MLSESIWHWQRDGTMIDLEKLLDEAAACSLPAAEFDTEDAVFQSAGDIPPRSAAWYTERGLRPPTRAQTARPIVESLAAAFADGVDAAARLSGTPVETVHIVGGGARNRLLCKRVADRVGVPVVAGPVEATAIGNVLIQARSHGLVGGDLDALRATVVKAALSRAYEPRPAGKVCT